MVRVTAPSLLKLVGVVNDNNDFTLDWKLQCNTCFPQPLCANVTAAGAADTPSIAASAQTTETRRLRMCAERVTVSKSKVRNSFEEPKLNQNVVQESCANVPRRGLTATSWRTGARRAGRSAPATAPAAVDCVNVSFYGVI